MLNPKNIKINDKIKFISIPEEWSTKNYNIFPEDRTFMKKLIKRSLPCRISEIDKYGNPCVHVKFKNKNKYEYHSWVITEKTGWRKVVPRKNRNP
jgi:hypothetical protein